MGLFNYSFIDLTFIKKRNRKSETQRVKDTKGVTYLFIFFKKAQNKTFIQWAPICQYKCSFSSEAQVLFEQ